MLSLLAILLTGCQRTPPAPAAPDMTVAPPAAPLPPHQQLDHLYQSREYARVVELGRRLLDQRPDDQMVLQLVALAHCQMKNPGLAGPLYDRLRPVLRDMVRRTCKKQGSPLPDR